MARTRRKTTNQLVAAAAAAEAARADIRRSVAALRNGRDETQPETRAWQDAIARMHAALAQIYPPQLLAAMDDLKQTRVRDAATRTWRWTAAAPASIEIAIGFLEADVFCFRSGYFKERLARRLARQPLAPRDEARLRAVVLAVLDRRGTREFRAYCRLAARVADADLVAAVEARLGSADAALCQRARWMRDAVA